MRKNKLIELLQSIKGNPEIVIWDGRRSATSGALIESVP